MRTVNLGQPIQKLPMSKKNEKWRKDNVNYIIGLSGINAALDLPTRWELQTLYDLYNSIYNKEDLKYITNPFNQEDGFPASGEDYNIVRTYIDSLVGEESKQPFNFRVTRTSEIASGEIMDKAKQMLMDFAQAYIMSHMGEEENQRYQQALQSGEIMTPEQIAKYLTKDYKDITEITAYYSLKYLRQKLNIDHEFLKGWFHALVGGLEYYYVGVKNGNPYIESINSIGFTYGTSMNVEFVHESDWCCREMLMTPAQIYDQLYDKMSEADFNKLLDMIEYKAGSIGNRHDKSKLDNWNPIYTRRYADIPAHNPFYNYLDELLVYHTCWKSYKKIGFVSIISEESGLLEEFQVDEDYITTGNEESVEWKWIIEVWEGWKIGDDLYVGVKPIEYQYVNTDLNSQRLPYTGAAYSNINSKSRSLLSIMKPLQYMYIILWYRLETFIARDHGKILNIDVTQIPVSMDTDIPKWLHYLQSVGVNFYNPYEEGWLKENQDRGANMGHSGINGEDLSQSRAIQDYVILMDKIESMMRDITGVNADRQGQSASNALVGVVENNVRQSTNITAPLFWKHNQIKKHALIMLLNTAKSVWRDGNKRYLNFILDDGTRSFLKLSEDFPYEDFDVFVTDSSQEAIRIEQIKQLVQPAMQNGASLMDVIDILTIDDITMLRHKMEEIEINRQQREQAIREQEQNVQLEIEQIRDEALDRELMIREAELDMAKYKVDVDAQTKIVTAQINAYRGSENMDQDANGIPDPMEIGDAALERQKTAAEIGQKYMQERIKEREVEYKKQTEDKKIAAQKETDKVKADIEKRKIQLEEKKLKAAEKLQRLSDAAAMDREKLKARTALKNKVSGEGKK